MLDKYYSENLRPKSAALVEANDEKIRLNLKFAKLSQCCSTIFFPYFGEQYVFSPYFFLHPFVVVMASASLEFGLVGDTSFRRLSFNFWGEKRQLTLGYKEPE